MTRRISVLPRLLLLTLAAASLSGCNTILEPIGESLLRALFITKINVPGFKFVAVERVNIAQRKEDDRDYTYSDFDKEKSIAEVNKNVLGEFYQLRVYYSSLASLEKLTYGNVSFPIKFGFGDPTKCWVLDRVNDCLVSGVAYRADGLEGRAPLPMQVAGSKDPERHYYYTYVNATHTQQPAAKFGRSFEQKSYDLKTNPQTVNAQFDYEDGNFNRYIGNLFQIPKEKIAEALANTPEPPSPPPPATPQPPR